MPKSYFALALASTSRFDVGIDESLDDPNDRQMFIETKSWSFRFVLPARDSTASMLSFLRQHSGHRVCSDLVIGFFQGVRVLLIKDSEFADRFWLRTSDTGQLVEFVLAGDDLIELTDAVAKLVQDLSA